MKPIFLDAAALVQLTGRRREARGGVIRDRVGARDGRCTGAARAHERAHDAGLRAKARRALGETDEVRETDG